MEKLRQLIEEKGLRYKFVAKKIGVVQSLLCMWRHGDTGIHPDHWERILELFPEISLIELYENYIEHRKKK